MKNKDIMASIASASETHSSLKEQSKLVDPLSGVMRSIGSISARQDLTNIIGARNLLTPPHSAIADAIKNADLYNQRRGFDAATFSLMQQISKDHRLYSDSIVGIMKSFDTGLAMQGIVGGGKLGDTLAEISKSIALSSQRFGMLAQVEVEDAIRGIRGISAPNISALQTFSSRIAEIAKPWAVLNDPSASVAAALQLSQFSYLSRTLPAFSIEKMSLIDREFGAFDASFLNAETAESINEAESIYTDGGRNESLVAFPSESYEDVLDATGWVFEVPQPDIIRADGTVMPNANIEPHDHFIISMVEAHLRVLIIQTLATLGGISALHSTFKPSLEKWIEKQAIAVAKGDEALHPIYFSDFMDLHDIIINGKFWGSFSTIFKNKDIFSLSMRRLHGIRLQTGHSRPLSMTARLRLLTEGIEIFAALGIGKIPN